MLKKILLLALLISSSFSLGALQIDESVNEYIDNIHVDGIEHRESARCKIILKALNEQHSSKRIEELKTQLLIELRFLQHLTERNIQRMTESINSLDMTREWSQQSLETYKKEIEVSKETLQNLNALEFYCY